MLYLVYALILSSTFPAMIQAFIYKFAKNLPAIKLKKYLAKYSI